MSYVKMEKKQCPVCRKIHEHDTGLLIHKQLKDIPEDETCTGYGLCEKHDKLHKDGFLAFVVVKSPAEGGSSLLFHEASYEGRHLHIKYEAFNKFMGTTLTTDTPVMYGDKGLFDAFVEVFQKGAVEKLH